MVKGKIKVLLLEDNPGDVLLIKEMFKEEVASRFELSSAASFAAGIKRLSEQKFDAVLLDLNLPDSLGIATARSLKQNAPDLPIVVLTGLADEVTAIEALQSGMEDYLVKGQITGALLAHSLRYAIERKRVEAALRESELKYRSLVEQSLVGILILQDARIVYMNNLMTEKSGYSVDEAVALSPEQLRGLIHPDDRDAVWSRMLSRLEGNPEPARNECRFVARDGSMYWADVHTSLIEYLGRPAIQMFIVDITERKRTDEALRNSEEKLRLMFESIKEGIFIVGLAGKVLEVNEGLARITGYSRKQLLGQSGLDYMFPGFKGDAIGMLQKMIARGGTQKEVVVQMKTAAGKSIEVEANSSVLRDGFGKPIGLIGTLRDISERRRAEEALRESEGRYRLLAENVSDVIWVSGMDMRLTYVSPSVTRLLGYTVEETLERTVSEAFTPDSLAAATQIFSQEIALEQTGQGDPQRSRILELELYRKDGTTVPVEANFSFMRNEEGNPVGILAMVRDISERKRADEALRASEERMRSLFEVSPDVIMIIDREGGILSINRATTRTIEETIGTPVFDYIPAEYHSVYAEAIEHVFRTGKSDRIETCGLGPGGRISWYEARFVSVRSGNEEPTLMVVATDITERKLADEALRASEEKYRGIFDESIAAVYVFDAKKNFINTNQAGLDLLGYSREELLRMSIPDVDADPVVVLPAHQELLTGGRLINYEHKLRRKDGTIVSVLNNSRPLTDAQGNIVGMLSTLVDVTERKRMDEALRESEEKFRSLVENASEIIFSLDEGGKVTYLSPSVEASIGYKPAELIGTYFKELVLPEDLQYIAARFQSKLGGEHGHAEFRVRAKNGDVRVIQTSSSLIIKDGKVIGLTGVGTDVTEQKKSGEALQARERYFRAISDLSSGAALVVSLEGNIVDITGGLERISGHNRESTLGRSALEFIHPDDLGKAGAAFEESLRDPGKTVAFEARLKNARGEWQWTESLITNLLDHHDVQGIVNHLVDITERKKAEEALRASEERYRLLAENATDVIWVAGMDMQITYVSPSVTRLLGYTVEEAMARSMAEAYTPDSLVAATQIFSQEMALEQTGQGDPQRSRILELELYRKDGSAVPVEANFSFLRNAGGNPVGFLAMVRDITERKKAEAEIRRHAKKIEALYGIAQVISQSSTIDAMLGEALDKVCDVMAMESGGIFMLDCDDRALNLKACKGLPEGIALKVSTIVVTEQGIEGLMDLTEPITDFDDTQDVVDVDKIREVVTELGRKAIVATPFFRGKDLQGLIVLFTVRERTFSRDDLELLKAISNEIAVGLNNIMLLEKTRDLSVTDELTGLYNRRHFFEMLDVEMNRATRTSRPFSLVMLDLDGFKEYNDKFGHTNGDAALQSFSQMLKESIRKSDLAFRYGGDEFALILPTADAARAKKIIQRARSIWQKSPIKRSQVVGGQVDFSTGIAEYPGNAESSDGLVFLADAALYQAKRNGGHDDKLVSELSTLSAGILDMATQDQVYALAATVDARDPYTYGHSQRVAEIAKLIGRAIGMAETDLAKLHAAALLHDVGKVGVPDAILTKMGEPDKEEWAVIKRHSAEGARIVSYVKELASLVPIILHHHEWYDGTGYPGGLKGIDIPLGARITSIADAYDTMVTKRPYRNVVSSREACEELRRFAGVQFDPALVEVWCKLVGEA